MEFSEPNFYSNNERTHIALHIFEVLIALDFSGKNNDENLIQFYVKITSQENYWTIGPITVHPMEKATK